MSDFYAIVSYQDDERRETSQNERVEVKKDQLMYILSSDPVCITKHIHSKEASPWCEGKLRRTEHLFETRCRFDLASTWMETELRDGETQSFRAERHDTSIRERSQ